MKSCPGFSFMGMAGSVARLVSVAALLSLSLSLSLFLTGCAEGESAGATGAGNPSPLARTQVTLVAADTSQAEMVDSLGTVFHVTEAFIAVSRLELVPDDSNRSAAGLGDAMGPWLVNLIEGSSQPSMDSLEVGPGSYQALRVRLAPQEVLSGSSLVVRGWVRQGAAVLPFEIRSTVRRFLESQAPQNVAFAVGAAAWMAITVDLSQWLSGIPLSRCIEQGVFTAEAGVVSIRAERASGDCRTMESVLDANLLHSIRFQLAVAAD